jgi:glycosyltransferase involved in cell wall biosynthesis
MRIKKVNIFIRKKANNHQHSVERFAEVLKKNHKGKNLNIEIVKCPVVSKGLFRRLYLICWSYFNQGDVNHILGDINYISIFMSKNKTINTFLDCRLLDCFVTVKKFIYKLIWFELPIKNSRIVTFISKFTKLQIEKKLNFKVKNSEVIPVPLTDNLLFRVNNNKIKNILIIGTSKHKNVKNMIIGIKDLDVNLTIIGELDHKIKLFCKSNKIYYKNLIDIGKNKIKKILAQNDILLMVSKYEGFGMPIIEAQASGLVVITSDIEPMKSVVGKDGLIVNYNNPIEITKKIQKLLKDKDYFLKILKKGKDNSKKYDYKIINDCYHKLYNRI